MDPASNPTPTPNPGPEPAPGPGPAPEPVAAPAPGAEPVPAPEPAQGPAPAPEPAQGSAPAPGAPGGAPVPSAPPVTPPVNPIIQPSGRGAAAGLGQLAATDPIMKPEAPTPPDPIEEELKAPMKAAGPVPGSIGSAVSRPADGTGAVAPVENPFATNPGQTPNVSFTDPATQAAAGANAAGAAAKPAKKKTDKKTLIALIAVAGVIVVVLIVVLIMQLMPLGGTSNANTNNQPDVTYNGGDEDNNNGNGSSNGSSGGTTASSSSLSCTKEMTAEEVAKNEGATTGLITVTANFDDSNQLTDISFVRSVTTSEGDEAEEVENIEATAEDLDESTALTMDLTVGADGELDLTAEGIQGNYEELDFTCEVL